jgi:outer membrane protein OmpA-like peptidoglycan-associated protein/tetratricopeptide (TPR) repeat protein
MHFRSYITGIFFLLLLLLFSVGYTSLLAGDKCAKSYSKKAEKIYSEGITSFKKGNFTDALIKMKEVIKEEDEFVDAYFVLGLVNYQKSNANLKEARKSFLKVVALCPSYDMDTYYFLGEIAYGNEEFDTTVFYMEKFLADVDKIKSDKYYNRAVDLLKYSKFYKEITSHPVPFDPKVVEGISTFQDEYLPILSPDNQMALYTRNEKLPPDRNTMIQTDKFKEKFMYSDLQPDGTFSEGTEMPPPFNTKGNQGGATLTIDNNTIYYTVCQNNKDNTYRNCDIYYSELINGNWTPIRSISDKVNSPMTWEAQPSISSDGKTLYFVSDRPGGIGGYDIFKTVKQDNGSWSEPINLGTNINSAGNEKSPFIHPDGKTLYFSSDGWPGLGGYDIFYSRLKDDTVWSKPVNLGYPINSEEDEVGFFVSTDGTKGFFASNKLQGKGGWDLYSFDLYPEARPEKIMFLKGTVKSESEEEPVKAKILLKNVTTKKTSEIPMDSATGNFVTVAPFNNDYIMTVKKEGYVYETRYISQHDSVYKMPARLDVEIQPIELNKSYRINDIYFGFNSFELTKESKLVLDQLIEFLSDNVSIYIQIQGYTDNIGNDADNLRLSQNRAKSVYNYLIANGITPLRLTYQGFGKALPVADNATEEGRAKNRRTVFVINRK